MVSEIFIDFLLVREVSSAVVTQAWSLALCRVLAVKGTGESLKHLHSLKISIFHFFVSKPQKHNWVI